ncbi:arsenate reductase [Cohaesibacter sp. ES.047]|uniref:arsenate reductase n=1 Tax=Cohaesibacter sp. ES.047 TaxID=1798205 RepID=UPI000BB8F2E3|nr:arsenate reductase [Cohaesibacter sp. ES.047]SNY91887.1 arsenate reductase [Cohaesibacter sp. ES.047]
MKLYGIKTCDTCRKALKAFEAAGKPVTFIDLRADGVSEEEIDRWIEAHGWEAVLNRRSTTWRGLCDADKTDVDADKAKALMLANPTLIKRPVFEDQTGITIGFGKEQQKHLLGN